MRAPSDAPGSGVSDGSGVAVPSSAMSDSTISFVVLAVLVALFVWNRLPVEVVALGGALTLFATDVLDLDQALAGFSDRTVIFIATLFVVSEGLDSSGVTTWAGRKLIERAGDSRTRLLVLMLSAIAALTALISVNGADQIRT